jgi:hypothetical protein
LKSMSLDSNELRLAKRVTSTQCSISNPVLTPSSPPTHTIFNLAKKGMRVVPLNTNGGSCSVVDVKIMIVGEPESASGIEGKMMVADLRNVVM